MKKGPASQGLAGQLSRDLKRCRIAEPSGASDSALWPALSTTGRRPEIRDPRPCIILLLRPVAARPDGDLLRTAAPG